MQSLDWQLKRKTVIVTGASSGSGAVIAQTLAGCGANLVLSGRNAAGLAATAAAVAQAGGRAAIVIADLGEWGSGAAIVQGARAAFGSIDHVVSNAGLFLPGALEAATAERLDRMLRVNVAGPLALVQAAAPHLSAGSAVVIVSSTTAHVGFPGYSEYTASKGAQKAMARALAMELAPRGIRVNTVSPGFVRTPMLQPALDANPGLEGCLVEKTPIGRIGEPEDVAAAVAFLLSPLSANVVGTTLVSDGGWIAQ
jgi:3-oxoacyl-[acyl-carrier protein] reductase